MRLTLTIATVLTMGACAESARILGNDGISQFSSTEIAPEDAAPGTCWDKSEIPGQRRTISEDVLVQPATVSSTGAVQSPPIYRTQSRDIILQEPQTQWFQIVCSEDLTQEFLTTLQRALELRGYFRGNLSGALDGPTRGAIRRYQLQENIRLADPGTLTIEAVRRLGLWAVDRPET